MKQLAVLWVLTILLMPGYAGAADGSYWSLGGGLLSFDDGVDTVEPKQVVGRFGYNFNPYLGIGFEGGFSLIEDELLGVDFDVTTTFLFVRGSLPVGETSSIYALIGPTSVDLTGTVGDVSISSDDDDIGTGFGFEALLDNVSFFVDYITYFDDNGVDVSSINFGVTSHF